jgi:predicted porin
LGPLLTLEKFAMKKTLIALATLAAAGTAFAQSTATISGSISYGIQNSGAAGAKAVGQSLGGGANAITISTREDLGGGMAAGFVGEMRFNSATGDVGGNGNDTTTQLFHQTNAFIGGGFGTVRLGKIAEANNCAFDPWGCTGQQGLASGPAGTGTSILIGAQGNANSVRYESRTVNGFSGSYQTTMTTRAEERTTLSLNYSKGPIVAQFLQTNGGIGNTFAAGNANDVKAQGTSIGASYNFGVARLSVVNAKTENAAGATTVDTTGVGLTVPMGATTLLAGYAKNKKAAATDDTKLTVGANYALSKRTTVGADVFRQDSIGGGTGFGIRARHTF